MGAPPVPPARKRKKLSNISCHSSVRCFISTTPKDDEAWVTARRDNKFDTRKNITELVDTLVNWPRHGHWPYENSFLLLFLSLLASIVTEDEPNLTVFDGVDVIGHPDDTINLENSADDIITLDATVNSAGFTYWNTMINDLLECRGYSGDRSTDWIAKLRKGALELFFTLTRLSVRIGHRAWELLLHSR
jgi:hypothetical protein